MKSILNYLKNYFINEIRWDFFLSIALFNAIFIYWAYTYKFSDNWFQQFKIPELVSYFLFYLIPFGGSFLLYSIFYKKWDVWTNKTFLILLIFTLIIYSYRCSASWHKEIIKNSISTLTNQRYWLMVSNQLIHGLILFIPIVIWWKFFDSKKEPLYGMKAKIKHLKPYFILLCCMIPLIIIAATQSDFLKTYPIVKKIIPTQNISLLDVFKIIFFELAYGIDFFMNEFFFRGFIIFVFAKYFGKQIIIPMASFYVFIHFGKPLGETISSFFGGLLLGVLAYETKSIYGGVILHIGIAYMMELMAFFFRL